MLFAFTMDILKTEKYLKVFIDCIKKAKGDQKKLIKILDKIGMMIVTEEFIYEFHPEIDILEHHRHYQFFGYPDEAADIGVDVELLIGVKYRGAHSDKVILYLHRTFLAEYEVPWPDPHKRINFKARRVHRKFPEKMNYEERRVWRGEYEKIQKNPKYLGSRFFQKWRDMIYELNPDMERLGV